MSVQQEISDFKAKMPDASPDSESGSEASDPLDLRDDEGWEDVEADVETLNFVSFFDDKVFPTLESMLNHSRESWNFDLVQVRCKLGLDFLETIKLVNFVRSESSRGNTKPEVTTKDKFADDSFLKPYLADDAVLFSLDELEEMASGVDSMAVGDGSATLAESQARIASLEEQLRESRETIEKLRGVGRRLIDTQAEPAGPVKEAGHAPSTEDNSYFKSYAFRDIHETMLKDTARTDAYRDFIYDNKHLFKDKVVLDVGCGTAILSMMCAKAGAKRVLAVDNSEIINKARVNVFANGLEESITCIHGKVEEIDLPVAKVDIIISEWMGYALLYEAMLDSVIWARDRWLVPGGLMIPCDMYLCIAPFADPSLVMEKVSFWNDVYGFDMTSMQEGLFDDVLIMDAQQSTVVTDIKEPRNRHEFLALDLYTAKVEDLSFSRLPFETILSRDIDALDGFVVWFDTVFGRENRSENVNELSTGPHAPPTHWMQTLLMIDHLNKPPSALSAGQSIKGWIGYERPKDNPRQLAISLEWEAASEEQAESGSHGPEKGKQVFKLE